MKVEIKEVENAIDWTKSQVVVSSSGRMVQIATNQTTFDEDAFCGIDLENGRYSNGWVKSVFKPETKQDFPIKLELTIESEQELCDLWHRMNLSIKKVDENTNDVLKFKSIDNIGLYDVLDILVKERNLYK